MATYYVGWDVGAWYCDDNSKSRDAIVVLDESGKKKISLRKVVRQELQQETVHQFLNMYFSKSFFNVNDKIIFAIDAVFSFPCGIIDLLSGNDYTVDPNSDMWQKGCSIENPFLFRYTERIVTEKKQRPLSVIQDSIGSQSSKILYFLKRYHFEQKDNVGVWESKQNIAIETYPSILGEKGDDIHDAHLCAELARDFRINRSNLYSPPDKKDEQKIIKKEGWIWFRNNE